MVFSDILDTMPRMNTGKSEFSTATRACFLLKSGEGTLSGAYRFSTSAKLTFS